jgi:hypothetical protein
MSSRRQFSPATTREVWPDPRQVRRLNELARSPQGRTVDECFPAIPPGSPSYEFASRLLKENPQSLQALSTVMREALRAQTPRSPLMPRRERAHGPETLVRSAASKRVASSTPGVPPSRTVASVPQAPHRPGRSGAREARMKRMFGTSIDVAPPPVSLRRSSQVTKRAQLVFESLDRIEKAWADDALWFLLSRLSGESAFMFQHLDQAQVEWAVLDGLEDVFRKSKFIETLCRVVSVAPYMDDYQREIITHALEHVQKGEYRLATSHLTAGLEGSIKRAAVELSILGEDRWLVGEKDKSRKNRHHSADAIIKQLQLDEEFERFLHRAIFGKGGNPVRHGEKPTNERRRALLGVVGIAGWMDVCLQTRASTALVNVMDLFLPEAVSRYRQLQTKAS